MTRRVRIAHLVSHPIQYFAPLYRELAALDEIDLTVFFYSDATVRRFADPEFGRAIEWDAPLLEGYDARILPSARGAGIDAAAARTVHWDIVRAATSGEFDALWLHGYAHATTWAVRTAARLRGMPVMIRDEQTLLHDRPFHRAAGRALALRAFYAAATGLYIGEQNRGFMRHHGVPERRLYFAPYCVDNDALRARARDLAPQRRQIRALFGINDEAPVVLFAGKLIDKKQPLLLIDAFARVRARTRCRLLIAGDGPLRAACEAAAAPFIEDVTFAGFLNQGELPAAYAAADIFVLPSNLHETWGLVVNEAMNFGLPVILSDKVGCGIDLVHPGINGATVPSGDAATLARAIEMLAADRELRTEYGAASRRIIERYSISACADGIVAASMEADRRSAWRRRPALSASRP